MQSSQAGMRNFLSRILETPLIGGSSGGGRRFQNWTRMHSSRMCTAGSSSHLGGVSTQPPQTRQVSPQQPPRPGTPPGPGTFPQQTSQEQTLPGSSPPGVGLETTPLARSPQLPSWVWAWRLPPPPARSPSTSSLACGPGVGLAWARKPARHAGIPPAMHAGIPPPAPVDRMTDTCKNITFTNFVCGGGGGEIGTSHGEFEEYVWRLRCVLEGYRLVTWSVKIQLHLTVMANLSLWWWQWLSFIANPYTMMSIDACMGNPSHALHIKITRDWELHIKSSLACICKADKWSFRCVPSDKHPRSRLVI